MDERSQHQRDQSTERLFAGLGKVLDELAMPFEDRRVPPENARLYLADHQIRGSEIDEMCREIEQHWPSVQTVACGVFERKYPYIALHIHPYDVPNSKAHEKLISNLRSRFPGLASVAFYCLGTPPPTAVSIDEILFQRPSIYLH